MKIEHEYQKTRDLILFPGTNIPIKNVQDVEVELLKKFDEICRANNINYQLFAGTLLGAIRHKGFIPWDDDIDVCMLRTEYEKFLKVCENKEILGEQFFLQTNATDQKSIVQFAKLRKNNTIFEDKLWIGEKNTHTGIWIDIFPLDNVEPGTKGYKRQIRLFTVLYAISSSSHVKKSKYASTSVKKAIRKIFYLVLKIVPKACVDRVIQKVLTQYDNNKTEYVNHLTNGVTSERLERFLRKRISLEQSEMAEFEGYLFPIPVDYDEVLTRCYGNYMALPPEEERLPHHGIIKIVT